MTDRGLPTYLTRQHSLSQAQLATALGAELLSLCQSVTADGHLAPEELQGLQQWVNDADAAALPAVQYLRTSIERVLADGRITPQEYREVYRAVEAILPFEARKQALVARQQVETAEAVARRRGEAVADTAIADLTFMVAGVRQEGRPELIERCARAGDVIVLARERDESANTTVIRVQLSSGAEIGFVPEEESGSLAPLLDGGFRYEARITELLTTGRSPIPVVRAQVFVDRASQGNKRLPAPAAVADSRPVGRLGLRLATGIALAVALSMLLYALLT
jgi:hypothetical protein